MTHPVGSVRALAEPSGTGVERQQPLQRLLGLCLPAKCERSGAQPEPSGRRARFELESQIVGLKRVFVPASRVLRRSEVIERWKAGGIGRGHLPKNRDRLVLLLPAACERVRARSAPNGGRDHRSKLRSVPVRPPLRRAGRADRPARIAPPTRASALPSIPLSPPAAFSAATPPQSGTSAHSSTAQTPTPRRSSRTPSSPLRLANLPRARRGKCPDRPNSWPTSSHGDSGPRPRTERRTCRCASPRENLRGALVRHHLAQT